MNRLIKAVLALAVCGIALTLCESVLPRSGVRKAAQAAIGLLFLELLSTEIAGILQ